MRIILIDDTQQQVILLYQYKINIYGKEKHGRRL